MSPSNEYSGLISFRIDWFDLAVGLRKEEKMRAKEDEILYKTGKSII